MRETDGNVGLQAQVGDRVRYRDPQVQVDGYYIAQLDMVAYVAALNLPQLIPLPASQLQVVERGALLRKLTVS